MNTIKEFKELLEEHAHLIDEDVMRRARRIVG